MSSRWKISIALILNILHSTGVLCVFCQKGYIWLLSCPVTLKICWCQRIGSVFTKLPLWLFKSSCLFFLSSFQFVDFQRLRFRSRSIFFSEMCSNDNNSISGNMCMMTEWDASFSGESTINPEFDVDSAGTSSGSSSTTVDLSMLPIDMTFNDGHILPIATYSVLLIISVCGNITVLVNLIRRRHISNPRVNIMLTHLAIADLLVSSKFSSYFCLFFKLKTLFWFPAK